MVTVRVQKIRTRRGTISDVCESTIRCPKMYRRNSNVSPSLKYLRPLLLRGLYEVRCLLVFGGAYGTLFWGLSAQTFPYRSELIRFMIMILKKIFS